MCTFLLQNYALWDIYRLMLSGVYEMGLLFHICIPSNTCAACDSVERRWCIDNGLSLILCQLTHIRVSELGPHQFT